MKTLRFVVILFVTGLALAVTYRVDPEGGPNSLASEVNAAFDAWLGLDDSLELELDDEATTVFGYGEDSLFGPDTLSLTVQRQDPVGVNVLLRPTTAGRANALLHETGLILGVSVAAEGVMNPALGDATLSLGEAEAEGLRQQLGAVPEDLNFDGEVNFYDLVELGKSFGQSGFSLPADIDESGVVDEADVELLRAAYTFSAPSETPPDADDLLTDEPVLDAPPETGEEGEGETDPDEEGEEDSPNAEEEGDPNTEEEPTTDPEQTEQEESDEPATEGETDSAPEETDGETSPEDETGDGEEPPTEDEPEDETDENEPEGRP